MTCLRWTGCVVMLLLVGTVPASAQSSADAYFHEAARQYVADNVPAARRAVEQGLAIAPSDPRLLALRKKLREGKRPQGQQQDSSSTGSQSGSQENENQSNQSSAGGQTPSPEQSGAAQTGDRESPSSQQGGSRSANSGAENRRPNANAQSSSGGQPADRPAPADTLRRGRGGHAGTPLSRAQAERLLRALEGQERQLLRQLRMRSSSRQKVEKDW